MDTGSMPEQAARSQVPTAAVAVIYFKGSDYIPGTTVATPPRSNFAQVLNINLKQVVFRTTESPENGSVFYAKIFSPAGTRWKLFKLSSRTVKAEANSSEDFQVGADIEPVDATGPFDDPDKWYGLKGPRAADYQFLSTTSLVQSLPPDAVCPILNSLILRTVSAGDRFIRQGDPGDVLYLIQAGICAAVVEKDGHMSIAARLREGDLVGEMAILTGENRSAHVDAETDMRLWALEKGQFEALSADHPELRIFLTDLMTHWFNTRPITAQRKIGKYLITDSVGNGGYSIVFKGLHQFLKIPVAVKMMKHDMAMDPDFLDYFHQEARTIAGFSHENIIKVYDIEERYRTVFIIMEYLEGRSLRSELNTLLRLSPRDVVQYLLQICSGLHYAHERGIIHQDIKPGNIFVLPGGQVKILDFGLACRCGAEGHFTGTPYYMSPEQIECLPIDERTDIYALGITAYELLTGERPYPEDDPHRMLDLHLEADIPDPAEFLPGLPEELRAFILKACSRGPERRYRNIPEALQGLQPLATQFGLPRNHAPAGNRKMTTFSLVFDQAQQATVNRMLDEFSENVRQVEGVELKVNDCRE